MNVVSKKQKIICFFAFIELCIIDSSSGKSNVSFYFEGRVKQHFPLHFPSSFLFACPK